MLYGQFYRQQRKLKKITLKSVAENSGCSQATISKFERGAQSPPIHKIEVLFDLIGYKFIPVDKECLK